MLITIFGVLNTIIAGLVAYLKPRGQPMRARMFRDDLEHVVMEIENSETMWLGIKNGVHGYNEIDIDDKVSVRSEVARLTRLYEAAVKKDVQNSSNMYNAGGGLLDPISGLRARSGAGAQVPAGTQAPGAANASAPDPSPASAPADDGDESPATAKNPGKTDQKVDGTVGTVKTDDGAKDKPANQASKKVDETADTVKTDDQSKDRAADQEPNTEDHGADAKAGATVKKNDVSNGA